MNDAAQPAVVVLDADAHPIDAVQRAAYRHSDKFTVEVTTRGAEHRCAIHFRPGADATNEQADLVHAFRADVLDEVLRARIRAETADVRNLILSVAFSASGLAEPDG